MTKKEIEAKIAEVISDSTDIPAEKIAGDSKIMDDLELSSLEMMTIVATLEEEFSVRIKTKDLQNVLSIGDLADVIAKSGK